MSLAFNDVIKGRKELVKLALLSRIDQISSLKASDASSHPYTKTCPSFILSVHLSNCFLVRPVFLDASSHLIKRLCPSVGRSVRRSVRRSVSNAFDKYIVFILFFPAHQMYGILNTLGDHLLLPPLPTTAFAATTSFYDRHRGLHL